MFIGYRLKTENLSDKFYPLEEFKDGDRTIRLFIGNLDFDVAKYKDDLKTKKIETLWATPGLPFIVSITIGYFISIFIGDIMLKIVMNFI